MNLTLSVPDEAIAESICEKWESVNQDVYSMLVEKLF